MNGFISGIREYGLRLDGRTMNEYRNLNIKLNKNYGEVEIKIGRTHVLCIVKGELVTPSQERASEGFISFAVDVGPLCLNPSSPTFRHNRGIMGIEIANFIERTLKETGAIDTEIMCIMSGVCSWSVKCDIHILFDDGNLFDSCLLAALSGLKHYRYVGSDIESFLGKLKCEAFNDKDYGRLEDTIKKLEMLPFNVHHFPLSVTIGYLKCREELSYIVDPTSDEESMVDTIVHISINDKKEICGINKFGGAKLSLNQVNFALELAGIHGEKLHSEFKTAFSRGSLSEVDNCSKLSEIIVESDFEHSNSKQKVESPEMRNILCDWEQKQHKSELEQIEPKSTYYPENSVSKADTKKDVEKNTELPNERVNSSDGICRTLEQVQLDQNIDSIELLNAVKSNVKIKKRKKG
ncbi:Exosome complex component RRP45 [Cryptosporidium felis]|nr:Exosome complex component RRP45 [Cryptosporidium felis]